jgi:hypothetical protein
MIYVEENYHHRLSNFERAYGRQAGCVKSLANFSKEKVIHAPLIWNKIMPSLVNTCSLFEG